MDEPSSGTSNRELWQLLPSYVLYAYGDGDASLSKWRELASSPLQPLAITPVTFPGWAGLLEAMVEWSNGDWRVSSTHQGRQAATQAQRPSSTSSLELRLRQGNKQSSICWAGVERASGKTDSAVVIKSLLWPCHRQVANPDALAS
jgi:hypothetical protein